MNNDRYGKLIGTYGSSRSMRIVSAILGIMFGVVGVFLVYLPSTIDGETVKFEGNVSILYMIGLGAIIIGALIILITSWMMKFQAKFFLYENAIRSVSNKVDRTDFFEDIEDLFRYFWGGFAYRVSEQDSWIYAGGATSRLGELTAKFCELHALHRGEKLFNRLRKGQTVTFNYISYKNSLSKSLVATRNLDYPTYKIYLTQHELKIEGRSIPINRIAEFDNNLWTETMQIRDVEGNCFFKTHSTAIMSLDVLYSLIWVQKNSFAG